MSGATVAVTLNRDASVRLAVSTSPALTTPVYSAAVDTVNRFAKPSIAGLSAGTQYYYGMEIDGILDTVTVGTFTTPDAAATSFKVCVSGDAQTDSNHNVFDAIRLEAPDLFVHLGDAHYEGIDEGINRFHGAYERIFGAAKQAQLYRDVPTVYVWDDHDYGPNDSDGTSASRMEATLAYRRRVPHFPLVEAGDDGAIYHSFEISVGGIGVIFIVTDQRSEASVKSATDNASKTMLGATQKTWFKNLLADVANDGKLFVWCCSRVWGGVATAGADHWGGFTTERRELCDHIQAECSGRIVVLSADRHSLAIDSGVNHDFVTAGSEPIPTFQCAPLDQTGATTYGGATYSEGSFANNNQYGIMEITKTGAAQLTVDWTGKRDIGTVLVTYPMIFNL